MTILLILLASVFTGVGIYHLSCAFVDVPTAGTSHMMMIAKKQTGSGSEKLFDVYLTKIADKLSPLLKMDPIKRNKLLLTLSIAGIPLTPESYTIKAFLTALVTALAGLPLFFIMPLMGSLVIGLAVLMWFSTYYKAFDLVKKRKKLIEAELPPLCRQHPAESLHRQGCIKASDLLQADCRFPSWTGVRYHHCRHENRQL